MEFVVALSDLGSADLLRAGGKAANLGVLLHAGLLVPGGFCITTDAYRAFIAANQLEARIGKIIASLDANDPALLDKASQHIRDLFTGGRVPGEILEDIDKAYLALPGTKGSAPVPVAVRSSATAEDLPDMSFAGQQETYLNIIGTDALQKAVVDCWSSLWTARAIGYRERNRIDHTDTALAVVVQQMIQSQVSGVMFTANPINGRRFETVIDATLGLGEALVSGLVEPDHYTVDVQNCSIINCTLGAKALAIRSESGGGVRTHQEDSRKIQALTDEQILDLAELGKRVTAEYQAPQDIEWALADGKLYLLQSRAVTSLYPIPPDLLSGPLKVLVSFGAIQGFLDPFTPLGADMLRKVFASGAGLFGYRVTQVTQTALASAGDRLWINITPIIKNAIGRRVIRQVFQSVEPTVMQAFESILQDPRLQPGRRKINPASARALIRGVIPIAWNLFLNLLAPERRRRYLTDYTETLLSDMRSQVASVEGDACYKLGRYLAIFEKIMDKIPQIFVRVVSAVAGGMMPLTLLNLLASKLPENAKKKAPVWNDLVLEVTRSLPHNPTTEMDLMLWETACTIRQDSSSRQVFEQLDAAELAKRYQSGSLPTAAQRSLRAFLDLYGGRGLGEIDTGRPRWVEDPTHIMQVLGSYMQIDDVNIAPDAVFERGQQNAEDAIKDLEQAVRKTRMGVFKAALVRWASKRVRAILGFRERPKFFAVRMMGIIRQGLLACGKEFTESGTLHQPDDMFYLTLAELRRLASRSGGNWVALAAERRSKYEREKMRRQMPRVLLSDGQAFYEGLNAPTGAKDGELVGSPVSPGIVEGVVHVVLDPRGSQLAPGEILVCPGTDPSWTPLFLAAGGLVMEVGGMMTHGAVVAREYGIPAVVGVHQATTQLKSGQRIRLNGSNGLVEVLSD